MYCKYHNSWNHSTNSCWSFMNIIQDRINKRILKFHKKKEAMVIDEDPFPPEATINTVATDLRAMLNAKKAERFSSSVRIRKVWIPRQYLVHKDDLATRRRVSTAKARKKNGRYPYQSSEDSKLEIKKKKFFKEKNVSPRERHTSPGEKDMNNPSMRKMPSRFIVPPPVSPRQEWHVVKHKKISAKAHQNSKKKDVEIKSYGKTETT